MKAGNIHLGGDGVLAKDRMDKYYVFTYPFNTTNMAKHRGKHYPRFEIMDCLVIEGLVSPSCALIPFVIYFSEDANADVNIDEYIIKQVKIFDHNYTIMRNAGKK